MTTSESCTRGVHPDGGHVDGLLHEACLGDGVDEGAGAAVEVRHLGPVDLEGHVVEAHSHTRREHVLHGLHPGRPVDEHRVPRSLVQTGDVRRHRWPPVEVPPHESSPRPLGRRKKTQTCRGATEQASAGQHDGVREGASGTVRHEREAVSS